ncbi:hypothetical protein EBZ39_15935 [bacterium]|nr:hypothetical protein [Betaproteobacteria bacterium]NDD55325.1 hypothetical protein [bacterium]
MDQKAVKVMCRVAQNLITVRGVARSLKGDYGIVREQIGNCLEEMARYCDASPNRLIGGDVDGIMANFEWEKSLQNS